MEKEKKKLSASLPSLTLAYIGDAVYELAVREHLLKSGACKVRELHDKAVAYVRAERQAALAGEIEPLLNEEERAVLRRGRNAKGGHQPPNASVGAYRRATGLEALIGHLYLRKEQERLEKIFAILFKE
ncbi:MAG: ribonuclease III [Clostridiales bacterium]|nr:ribonuclease III [Clostridiales bacterium]